MGLLEKISKKNPPRKALIIPEFFLESSKKFKIITVIKIRFGEISATLKWIKKLAWSRAKM